MGSKSPSVHGTQSSVICSPAEFNVVNSVTQFVNIYFVAVFTIIFSRIRNLQYYGISG